MRIAFSTLGCKINQYETDLIRQELASKGNTIVPFDDEADIYIINTCTVTAKSDYQSRQVIRSAVRKGRGARVVVTGCYASTQPEEIKKISGVSFVLDNTEKKRIHEYLTQEGNEAARFTTPIVNSVLERTRGFLKIQDGCDNACSYCIVPQARGASRSIQSEDVLKEFKQLVHSGCPEIVITGIHVGTYGVDLQPITDLTSLLQTIVSMRNQSRIRLSSIEPKEITQGIVQLLDKGLCKHLHIPLQSGDDHILSAMNRDYTAGFYLDLVRNIVDTVPGIALGADVMVGFPGEGVKEFRNTMRLIEDSPLTHLHVFSYSARPGTVAAQMKDQVPEHVKKERNEELRKIGKRKNFEFRKKFLGEKLPVIVEDKLDTTTSLLTGLTDNYIRTVIQMSNNEHIGKKVTVRIVSVDEEKTFSEIC